MRIYNHTSNKYIAFINGREYILNAKKTIEFDCYGPTRVDLIARNKNRVFLNILDIFLEIFVGDSTYTTAYCNYSFLIQNCSEEVIRLEDNYWSPRNQLTVNSCYADTEVINEQYQINNFPKLKRKHRNMHLFFSSLPLIGILLLVLAFVLENSAPCILAFVVWFVLFPVASIKEMKRFKSATEPNLINETLCRYADERRNGKMFVSEDISKTGKFVGKILGKMFKFDEEK